MTGNDKKLNKDVELMTRVASLYYLEAITQNEIAHSLGLSRPKVGRLLKRAREEGIVEIQINTHPGMSIELEKQLQERFQLEHVLLSSDQRNSVVQRAQLARMVASFLARRLHEEMVIAVGMGRNTSAIPDAAIGHHDCQTCTFVSALGGSPQVSQPENENPNDICRRLVARFGGKARELYAPAYASTAEIRDAFLAHEQIRQTLDTARQADIALVGIGDAYDHSAVVQMGCFNVAEMRQLREQGAVGDILGTFFAIDGQRVSENMQNRVVGLSYDDLWQIPCVLGIASEASKIQAILGALRSGLLNVLATSIGNARMICEADA